LRLTFRRDPACLPSFSFVGVSGFGLGGHSALPLKPFSHFYSKPSSFFVDSFEVFLLRWDVALWTVLAAIPLALKIFSHKPSKVSTCFSKKKEKIFSFIFSMLQQGMLPGKP